MIFCFVGTYQKRLKPLRVVDLDVGARRVVSIDVLVFLSLVSGRFGCLLDLVGVEKSVWML